MDAGRLGNWAAQTQEVKGCTRPAPSGHKGERVTGRRCRSGSVCAPPLLATHTHTGRMRFAVGALLACAALGECGRRKGLQSTYSL